MAHAAITAHPVQEQVGSGCASSVRRLGPRCTAEVLSLGDTLIHALPESTS